MINRELLEAIRRKKGARISVQALYQGFSSIRKKYGNTISKEEASFIYASNQGIDVFRFLKNNDQMRDRIRNLLSSRQPATVPVRTAKKNNISHVQKILNVKGTRIDDPLLPASVIQDAQNMSEIYPMIYVFENSVRNFLHLALDKAFPEGWWNEKRIPSTPKKKAESRKQEEGKNLWHGGRSNRMLDYVDLDELESIIDRNTETLTQYLRDLPKGLDWLKMKIKEIYPSRNILAHCNPLGKHDIDRVKVICGDWQRQLPKLKEKLEEKHGSVSINKNV